MSNTKNIYTLEKSIMFHNTNDIYFPNICLVCGKETDRTYKKSIYGKLDLDTYQKKNYHFSLPICNRCQSKIFVDKNEQLKHKRKIGIFLALSFTFALVIGLLTYSILFSLAICLISFLFPYLNYRIKYTSKHSLNLNNYLQIDVRDHAKTIKLSFLNKKYLKLLEKVNLKKPTPSSTDPSVLGIKDKIIKKTYFDYKSNKIEDSQPTAKKEVEELDDQLDKTKSEPIVILKTNEMDPREPEMSVNLDDFDMFKKRRKRPKKTTKSFEFINKNKPDNKDEDI